MHWIDPDSLPETTGVFERFLINPHGEADGLILTDGREVHFPPHMGAEIIAAVEAAPKTTLRLRGVRPRGADMVSAVAITVAAARIDDRGPPDKHERPPHPQREPMTAEGVVRLALHGPKGETRGALLESGVILRFPPHEAEALAELIAPGAKLAVRGKGLTTRLGTVIEAHEVGADERSLRAIGQHKKPPKPKKPHHEPPHHHPRHHA